MRVENEKFEKRNSEGKGKLDIGRKGGGVEN
jgi:hypothetical protein